MLNKRTGAPASKGPRTRAEAEPPPETNAAGRSARRDVAWPWLALGGLCLLSVITYALIARKHLLPDLFPDEMYYGKMSQNFAAGHGLEWRGSGYQLPPLWPALLSIAWHFGSVPHGYGIAKTIGVISATLTAVPVWLLGRELAGPRLALIPAALCLMGSWMQMTGFLASENLAFPLATASLACVVMTLRRPGMRWLWASLAFAVLGMLTRTQLFVLPVILLVALVLDVLRFPREVWRDRINSRPRAVWVGLIVVVVGGAAALAIRPSLTHYALLSHHASAGTFLRVVAEQAPAAFLMLGFVPLTTAVGLMFRSGNWRSTDTGPLLTTLIAAVIVLVPVVSWFEAYTTHAPVDRYIVYLMPLALVALVLAPGRLNWKAACAAGVVLAVGLFALPRGIHLNFIEEPSVYGSDRVLQARGVVVVLAVLLSIAAMVLLGHRRWARHALTGCVLLAGAVMVMQGASAQSHEINQIARYRPLYAPRQLDWVDKHAVGRAAGLDLGKIQETHGNYDDYTDFFNRSVDDLYSTVAVGAEGVCHVQLVAGGRLAVGSGAACRPWPRNLVIELAPFRATLYGQRVLARTPLHGTLVRIPRGAPRVLGLVKPPCPLGQCIGAMEIGLYLSRPGALAITFGPGDSSLAVAAGPTVYHLSPNRKTVVRFPVAAGNHGYQLRTNWTDPTTAPRLMSVVLNQGSQQQSLW